MHHFAALILAGGKGRRAQYKDKGLLHYEGRPLIEHMIEKIPRGYEVLYLSCNRNVGIYKRYGGEVLEDLSIPGVEPFAGPLLGIYSALSRCQSQHLLVLPCDTPLLSDQVMQALLHRHLESRFSVTVAATEGNLQPLHLVMAVSDKASIARYLREGRRSVRGWVQAQNHQVIDFGAAKGFTNMNSPKVKNP